jgi:predicted transposase YbfD/YdcC
MYPLNELLFLSLSALISGMNDWQSTIIFGEEKLDWLQQYFPYKYGIPSADTLERLFASLDPVEFEKCFRKWVNEISHLTDGEVIAIDGKTICGSYDKLNNVKAKHIVTAYATQSHISLGQEVTAEKSNEITAIPKLLEMLCINGCLVSIDAMGCQKEIISSIRQKDAHYLVAVKQNQKGLHQQVEKMFQGNSKKMIHVERNVDHGRVEIRKCTVVDNLKFFDDKEDWLDIKSVIMIETEVFNKTTKHTGFQKRFYISSALHYAEKFNSCIRSHWAIENSLHWMLDVSFGEDGARRRKNNHAINFNLMAKTALGLIKNNTDKIPMSHKKRKASFNNNYREKILGI